MQKVKGLLTLVVVIAIIGGSFVGYKVVNEKHKEAQMEKAGKRDMSVTVQTGKVGRSKLDEVLTFNGDIQAMQSVELQPRISGRILKLELEDGTPVEEGVFVKKGQFIGFIDDRDLKAQLANAEAAVAAAEASETVASANVINAEAAILNAKASHEQRVADHKSTAAAVESAKAGAADKQRELQRQKNLFEKQAATQQAYDQAVTANDQAEADLRKATAAMAAAEAQIRSAEAAIKQAEANLQRYKANVLEAEAAKQQAKANLEQARVNFSETKLYSPMNGVVSKRHVDPGAMVSPTTTILTILDMEIVKVLLSVPVNYLPSIVPGETKARMRTISLPGKEIDCTIEKIYPAIDISTRTALVEIRIKNFLDKLNAYQLKDGMYATVEVLILSKPDVLAVDSALPIRNLTKNIIYRVKGDTVEAVDVKLGIRFNSMVEILSGLEEGDEIVVVGQHRLTDGATIKILPGNNLEMKKSED